MVEFTFLEIHVQDASFTKGDGHESADDGDVSFEVADDDLPPAAGSSSKGTVLAALVGLVFLAAVAYLVKSRFLSDGEEEEEFEFDNYD